MEPLRAKRKQRKTRKNLNEMRKQAKHKNILVSKKKFERNSYTQKKSKPLLITTNRLTLFSRAVRSETVTRSTGREFEYSYKSIVPKHQCNYFNNSDYNNSFNIDEEIEKDKVLVTTPSNTKFHYDSSDSDLNNFYEHSKLSESLTSEGQSDNDEYTRFINEFSKNVEKIAPFLLRKDEIEKRSLCLRKACEELENKNKSDEMNTESCELINSSDSFTSNTIVENPMSDIGNSYQFAGLKDEASPAHSFSSLTSYSSPVSLSTIFCDSPEYSYYPHKLNE